MTDGGSPMVAESLLEGSKVILRRLESGDAVQIFGLVDPEISRNTMLPSEYRLGDAAGFIVHSLEEWEKGSKVFGIVVKETGKLAGTISIEFRPGSGVGEIGYWIGRQYWGKGMMKEAISLMLRYGFESLQLRVIEAKVFTFNTRSAKRLEHAGFHLEGVLQEGVVKEGRRYDALIYSLSKDEWASGNR